MQYEILTPMGYPVPTDRIARDRWLHDAEQTGQGRGPFGPDRQRPSSETQAADVVRYDTAGKEVRYWLKHKGEMQGLLKALHKVVHASSRFE